LFNVDRATSLGMTVALGEAGETLLRQQEKRVPFMRIFRVKFLKAVGFVLLIPVALAGFAMATGAMPAPWQPNFAVAMRAVHMPWQQAGEEEVLPGKPEGDAVELVEGRPHTLTLPEEVRKTLGIRKGNIELIAVAQKPTLMRPLVMPGSTALDPTRLMRIRARFAPSPSSAEVIEIGQVPEDRAQTGKVETVFRELRSGDKVKKGDLLAVFYSVDVGNKKNDLVDAIYQLKLDEQVLKRAEEKA
jgi:bifunctional DNA-binding transcriptional regulator/antitoxin component of YhaV-PrlF toxin-antitoxin module